MIDLNVLLNRIHISLKKLQETNLPEIERDILLEDLRVLYGLLKETNPVVEKVAPFTFVQEQMEVIPVAVVKKPIVANQEPELSKVAVEEIKEYEKKVPELEKVQPETSLNVPLNEIFSAKEQSLNERLGPQEVKKALNDQVASRDLKTLIDFNKQIALTKELFNNDATAFATAIAKLNALKDIQQAFDFVTKELVVQYKWDKESQAVRLFDKLLRQKFGLS